ncbi:MAG: alkaline phosphatase family protein [Actinomycetota bacterium]|nr:alkaline phosphatase family protein [Actinomycetota bacterium]
MWIWMENHTNSQVIGSSAAPFETTLARQCGTASRYASVGSPSLPNYLGATSGTISGIQDDGDPASHPLTVDNLFRQVRASGRIERSYEEGMPAPCRLVSGGSYAAKHNPASYYTGGTDRAACQADDVPLGSIDAGALAKDLAADTLPAFSFVTPDLCHDTHDCSVATGDAWLSSWMPRILSSAAYRSGATAVVLMWDEPTPMPNIMVTPSTPAGTVVPQSFNHYSLLRTTEDMLGLPLLAGAAGAPSMRAPFRM